MKNSSQLWRVVAGAAAVSAPLLLGCLGGPDAGNGAQQMISLGSLTSAATSASLALQNDWGAGYCATVTVTNGGTSPTTTWQVVINLNQSTSSQVWSATGATAAGSLTATPLSWNTAIPPGGSTSFGFCGSATGTNYRPALASVSGTGNGSATTTGGSGGATASGGATGSGSGGATASGGRAGTGGVTASGGASGTAGAAGKTGSGSGGSGTGGAVTGSGGSRVGSGGATSSGGATGTGGRSATGGVTATGGATATGGSSATGTGGAAATGGATGTGGGATQCTFPATWTPNNGTGTFTWYFFGQGSFQDSLGFRTACGYIGKEPNGQASDAIANIANPAFFAAIPGVSNFNTVDHCGACAQITNGSKSIVVTIVDECPYDNGQNPACGKNPTGHLDLSFSAWSALGYNTGAPTGTTWKYVACPVAGGVVARIHGDPSWGQVYIENEVLPIASVKTSNGAAGTRSGGGGFWQLSGTVALGQTLSLTDVSGRTITTQIASLDPAANVSSGTQFPMCQ